ncbi:RNA polymerase sigma-70 factor [Fodinibius sp.]|uniref:RNA polymerase sigma factor n=1 Tax=Fodinibius sp. TaxID=1872440 RepID=UPI002ACE82D2|nr:RNA polymerase sigma-70 factor [Fodinibius sp.]MDZ7660610.1 RNA polymerase sigma-70 factor [Fodinibius sp.]
MDSISDDQFSAWARSIRNGDEIAFKNMFDATFENYVRYAWRFTKNKDTAMDIVQESFIKLWQIRSNLDPSKSLKTYLYQIVKNNALNYLRDTPQDSAQLDDLQIADESSVVFKEEQESELLEPLKKWIDELPDRQQEAFKLSRYEGLSHDEIAEIMDISARTVNNHIVAALNNLQERYKTYKDVNDKHYE